MAKYKKNRGNGNEDNEFVAPKGVKVFEEITNLETRIEAETPEKGFSPPLHQAVSFSSLPISS